MLVHKHTDTHTHNHIYTVGDFKGGQGEQTPIEKLVLKSLKGRLQ